MAVCLTGMGLGARKPGKRRVLSKHIQRETLCITAQYEPFSHITDHTSDCHQILSLSFKQKACLFSASATSCVPSDASKAQNDLLMALPHKITTGKVLDSLKTRVAHVEEFIAR